MGQQQNRVILEEELVSPRYLVDIARKKFSRLIMIGAPESDLADFWDTIEVKGACFTDGEERPVEDSKLVVDITAKEHCNNTDINDVIEVATGQQQMRKVTDSYSLAFGKESGWEFGGGLNVGGSFFNTAGAFLGIEGKRHKKTWSRQEQSKVQERSLAQSYGVKATEITVPPKTKLTVRITTYVVTYKRRVKVVFSVPVTSRIPIYFRRYWLELLCIEWKRFRRLKYVDGFDLFQNQNEFQDLGYCIQFSVDSELSYVGETVELYKELTKLP